MRTHHPKERHTWIYEYNYLWHWTKTMSILSIIHIYGDHHHRKMNLINMYEKSAKLYGTYLEKKACWLRTTQIFEFRKMLFKSKKPIYGKNEECLYVWLIELIIYYYFSFHHLPWILVKCFTRNKIDNQNEALLLDRNRITV